MKLLASHDHGRKWCNAFAEGLGDFDGDLLVTWGVRWQAEIRSQLERGGEVCVLECGYIGNRLEWCSASLGGGLNGRGRFPKPGDGGQRFNSMGRLAPWRYGGEYALICGQVPGDMSVAGVCLPKVYRKAAEECAALGFKPVFRPHPKGPMPPPPGVEVIEGTLDEALSGAAFVVTFNSNAGVDAALAGVPVVALDRGSMAWDVASPQVAPPWRPDRAAWATALAWKQWTLAEFKSGMAWEYLRGA